MGNSNHLCFDEGDLNFFWERSYPRSRLQAKFLARRLVLELAQFRGAFVPEPGDLSEKAKPVEARILSAWQKLAGSTMPK